MSTEIRKQSPLVNLKQPAGTLVKHAAGTVKLHELPATQLANLRLRVADGGTPEALRGLIGADLPTEPNTVTRGKGVTAIWLGPDEWLLKADTDREGSLAKQVEEALAGTFFAVTDQSSGFVAVHLHGVGARDVINGGCPLDLHPRRFAAGTCAQSRFHKASILLLALEGDGEPGNDWEIIVRRSFAAYTVGMLIDAMDA